MGTLAERLMPWRRHKRRIKQLEKEIRFLYRYLGLNPGERQYSVSLDDVREDHLGRYEFACRYIRQGQQVADAACGIGYGSYLIADRTGAHVTGIDIAESAIQSANRVWKHTNNEFLRADCTDTGLARACMDVAVSFETIEHVPDASALLRELFGLLRPGGTLICSTPNQDVWPHDPVRHKYHVRHYTAGQITELLEQAGFRVKDFWSQASSTSKEIVPGTNGMFHIVIAGKPE